MRLSKMKNKIWILICSISIFSIPSSMQLANTSNERKQMFYKRVQQKTFKEFAKFPAIAILGPRQSGKTTLAKKVFKNHTFLSMEDPDIRDFAKSDPKGFLLEHENKHGIILDEFQYIPEILSYIQLEIDEKKRLGYFILTGSQNFLVNESITQSLAGRIGIVTLLPLSLNELISNKLCSKNSHETIFKGGYPRLYADNFLPEKFYPSYLHTYIERDVRQLVNVKNLSTFKMFMKLCAGRVGQILNLSDLSTACGIMRKTANEWLSILEASYILFRLQPYFKNYNKRVIKKPKLYFYDTGLACSLLNIKSHSDLSMSMFKGPLFENLIISDIFKQFHNAGNEPSLYYWRDKNGNIEVDGLLDYGVQQIPIELKSGQTITPEFFIGLNEWNKIAGMDPTSGYLIYGGELVQKRKFGNVLGWKAAANILERIEKK